jgi:hypothetical protein
MNNIIKMRLLLPFIFALIAIVLYNGISTAPLVDDVFSEKDKEGRNSNTKVID